MSPGGNSGVMEPAKEYQVAKQLIVALAPTRTPSEGKSLLSARATRQCWCALGVPFILALQ